MVTSSRLAVPVLFIACMVFVASLAIPQISHAKECSFVDRWIPFIGHGENCYPAEKSAIAPVIQPTTRVAGSRIPGAQAAPAPAPAPTVKTETRGDVQIGFLDYCDKRYSDVDQQVNCYNGLIKTYDANPARASSIVNPTRDASGNQVINSAVPASVEASGAPSASSAQTDPYQTATEFSNNAYDAYATEFTKYNVKLKASGSAGPEQLGGPLPTDNSAARMGDYTFNRMVNSCGADYSPTSEAFQVCMTSSAQGGNYDTSDFYGRMQQYVSDQANPASAPVPAGSEADWYSPKPAGSEGDWYPSTPAGSEADWYPPKPAGSEADWYPSGYATPRLVKGSANLYTTDPSSNRELGPFPAPLEENSGPTKCWSWLSWVPGCEGSRTTSAAEDGGTVETYTPSYQPTQRSASQPYEDLQSVSYGPTSPTVPQPLRSGWSQANPELLGPEYPGVSYQPLPDNWYKADPNLLDSNAPVPQQLPDNWYKADPSVLNNNYPGVSPSPASYTVRCAPGDSSCTDTPGGPVWDYNQPLYEEQAVEQYSAQTGQQYEPYLGEWDYSDNPYAGIPLVEEDTAFQAVQQESQQAIESSVWQAFFDPSSWWPWGGDTEASNKPTRQFSTAVPFSETLVNQSLVASAFGAFLASPKK